MTKRLVGRTIWRQELTRAINSNRAIRRSLTEISEMGVSQTINALLTRAALALVENLEALRELERIVEAGADEYPPIK